MAEQKVFMLVGVPASGKSTWGEKFAKDHNYTYLSSDRNRARVGTGEEDQKASGRAFALLKQELGEALDRGESVVVDACFNHKKARSPFIAIARNRGVPVKAVVFKVPREELLRRNSSRARVVPTFVIDQKLSMWEDPEVPGEVNEIETIEFK